MQVKKITEVATLTPGVVFIPVEAYGDGGLFQVGTPLVVVREPPHRASEWSRASRYFIWVRKVEDADKSQNTFSMSIPSKDGVNIEREPSDYSAFFVDTPGIEKKLHALSSIEEYREFAEL